MGAARDTFTNGALRMEESMDVSSMRVARGGLLAVCCLTSASVAAQTQTQTRTQTQTSTSADSAIDPKAIKALTTTGDFLRKQQKFTIDMNGTKDQVLPNGFKVTFGGTVQYEVSRPNHLHATIKTDRKQREVFYDGKTVTLYAPRMHYYASAPAPTTIKALMDTAAKKWGLEFPLADMFTWGTDPSALRNISFASYIGPAEIDGVRCDQYVFRQGDVDWQVWIQHGDAPLPKRFVITTTSEPSEPSYMATLNWNLSPTIAADAFAFTPPADAKRITLTEANVRVARTKP